MPVDNARGNRASGEIPWSLYGAATLLMTGAVSLALALHGTGEEGLRFASTYSARVSLLFFLLVFLASALARLRPGPAARWLMARRRHAGLTFAWTHLLHLGVFVAYFVAVGHGPSPLTLWVGGAGYLGVAVLALTSNDRAQRVLGASWRRLHVVLVHYLWLVFTLTYAGFLAKPGQTARAVLGLSVCLAALGVRIASRAAQKTVLTPGRPPSS